MELKDATLKDLFEDREELFDEIKKAGADEIREELEELKKKLAESEQDGKAPDLQEEIDKLRQDLKDAERRSLIESKLRAAGLSDVPEALQKALALCPSDEEVGALLEAFGEQQKAQASRPRSRPRDGGTPDPKLEEASLIEAFSGGDGDDY